MAILGSSGILTTDKRWSQIHGAIPCLCSNYCRWLPICRRPSCQFATRLHPSALPSHKCHLLFNDSTPDVERYESIEQKMGDQSVPGEMMATDSTVLQVRPLADHLLVVCPTQVRHPLSQCFDRLYDNALGILSGLHILPKSAVKLGLNSTFKTSLRQAITGG